MKLIITFCARRGLLPSIFEKAMLVQKGNVHFTKEKGNIQTNSNEQFECWTKRISPKKREISKRILMNNLNVGPKGPPTSNPETKKKT